MISFSNAVQESMPKALAGLPLLSISVMDYSDELELKNRAFAVFCERNGLPVPEKIVESPLSRNYRTTTKRRAGSENGRFRLFFGADERLEYTEPLEPEEHLAIYRFVEDILKKPAFAALAEALNWIIVRGSYKRRAVIFNVGEMNAAVVRKLKLMGEHLNVANLGVVSAHVYFDPTRSDYYLEAFRPADALGFKTLFGPKELSLDLGAFRLKYPVTGFSQINESQIPNLLAFAKKNVKAFGKGSSAGFVLRLRAFFFRHGGSCRFDVGRGMERSFNRMRQEQRAFFETTGEIFRRENRPGVRGKIHSQSLRFGTGASRSAAFWSRSGRDCGSCKTEPESRSAYFLWHGRNPAFPESVEAFGLQGCEHPAARPFSGNAALGNDGAARKIAAKNF